MKVKSNYIVIRFSLAIILFLNSCGSASEKNTTDRHTAQSPSTIEEAMALAKTEAGAHDQIDFTVEHVTNSELSHPFYTGYYFLIVWGPMGHSQSSYFAIAGDGSSFKLPEDFNLLSDHAGITLSSQPDAISLLEFYLNFHTVWPGTDYQKIVESLTDIPGFEAKIEDAGRSWPSVSPVNVSTNSSGWSVEFYSWRAINGVLFNWHIKISRDANLEVERSDRLGEKLGNFLSIE